MQKDLKHAYICLWVTCASPNTRVSHFFAIPSFPPFIMPSQVHCRVASGTNMMNRWKKVRTGSVTRPVHHAVFTSRNLDAAHDMTWQRHRNPPKTNSTTNAPAYLARVHLWTCPCSTAKVSQVCVTSPVRFSISAILGIDKLEAVGPARTSIYVYQNLNFDFYHFSYNTRKAW